MTVRMARPEDLDAVNRLRRQVNDVHVQGRPETFKPGFCDELRDYLYTIWQDPAFELVVAEDGGIRGFAVLHHILKPENPYMYERKYLDIDVFCVDVACRRKGIATAMVDFIRNRAKAQGFDRIELNMWEFNRGALSFYEAVGFSTYRRYMEMKI